VGRWLTSQGYGSTRSLTVVPAGERWPDGSLRPAVEDLLGAGAVLAALDLPSSALSPEAAAARAAFLALGPHDAADAVRTSSSGQELIEGGFAGDVDVAVELDASTAVPVLVGGCFRAAER
jgi:2-phosphosulfolactate phosphatase